MRTRKKWLWLIFVIVAIVASGVLIWSVSTSRPSPVLNFPNGEQFRFVGVTYGTNMVPPLLTARLLNLLPAKMANALNTKLGSPLPLLPPGPLIAMRAPPAEPMYRFWFRRVTPANPINTPGYGLAFYGMVLADKSGNLEGYWNSRVAPATTEWSVFGGDVMPRRSPEITCWFYNMVTMPQTPGPVAEITVPNPFYRHFPEWTPEPLPAVKRDGDLEVRLNSLSLQRQLPTPIDGIVYHLSIRSPTDAEWALDFLELGDATSNILKRNLSGAGVFGGALNKTTPAPWRDINTTVAGTLWPDEAAWKLRFSFKQVAGFASNELVTLTNVPVPTMGSSNIVSVTNGGHVMTVVFSRITIYGGFVFGGRGGGGGLVSALQAEWRVMPADLSVDCEDAKTDIGDMRPSPGTSRSGSSVLLVLQPLPANAQTMTLTFAIQKPRTVEFFVKPPKPD